MSFVPRIVVFCFFLNYINKIIRLLDSENMSETLLPSAKSTKNRKVETCANSNNNSQFKDYFDDIFKIQQRLINEEGKKSILQTKSRIAKSEYNVILKVIQRLSNDTLSHFLNLIIKSILTSE